MKLKIRGVYGENLEEERIIVDVLEDINDLGHYILFDTTYDDKGKKSNKHRHSYFFPNGSVKKNEVIMIYTKSGKDILSPNPSTKGTKLYYIYWGLDICVWNNDKDKALLVHVDDYTGKNV